MTTSSTSTLFTGTEPVAPPGPPARLTSPKQLFDYGPRPSVDALTEMYLGLGGRTPSLLEVYFALSPHECLFGALQNESDKVRADLIAQIIACVAAKYAQWCYKEASISYRQTRTVPCERLLGSTIEEITDMLAERITDPLMFSDISAIYKAYTMQYTLLFQIDQINRIGQKRIALYNKYMGVYVSAKDMSELCKIDCD